MSDTDFDPEAAAREAVVRAAVKLIGIPAALDRLIRLCKAQGAVDALTHEHYDGRPRMRCTGAWCSRENTARVKRAAATKEIRDATQME